MKRLCSLLLVLGLASIVSAGNTIYHTVTPDDLEADKATFYADDSVFYGWDWDEKSPEGVTDKAYTGDGSFYGNVVGSAAGGSGSSYTALRINVSHLFGYEMTFSELDNLIYSTDYVGPSVDWQVKVYTNPLDDNNWYGTRINYNRGNSINTGWSTYAINDVIDMTGAPVIDGLGISYVTDKYPSSADYSDETIKFIDIILSYATSSPSGESYLDNIVISDIYNTTHVLDLEASPTVPAPGAIFLAGLGTSIVGRLRRRMI